MKKFFIFLVLGLLQLNVAHALTCDRNFYKILCRGKQHAQVTEYAVEFIFAKNGRAAGNMGENLSANSCAWSDRPVSQTEPNRLYIGAGLKKENWPAVNMALECMTDKECVVEVCAQASVNRDGTPTFLGLSPVIQRWYPVFK